MAEDNHAIRWAFADLTGLRKDTALIASEGQGIKIFDGGGRQFRFRSKTMDRIRRRLDLLEVRLI